MEIQSIRKDTESPNVVTGILQIGTNEPGLFISGLDAVGLALSIAVLTERCKPKAESDETLGLAMNTIGRFYEMVNEGLVNSY